MRTNRDYLTSYHRLSSSSHINAEETIRWLIGTYYSVVGQDPQLSIKLACETVSYSAMMTGIAVAHYIEANIAAGRALKTKLDEVTLQKTMVQLTKSIDEIASAAGSPM